MSAGAKKPTQLWLGYNGLMVSFEMISAVLAYQPAWDRRIEQAFGSVPSGIQAVVLLTDGRMFPSRRSLDDLHARWTDWQRGQAPIGREALEDTTSQADEQA